MRRKLVLGIGLAALVGGSAAGQFASDRAPAPPTPPVSPTAPAKSPASAPARTGPVMGGFEPVKPAAPVSPVRPSSPSASDYQPLYSSAKPAGGYVPPVGAPQPASATVPAGGAVRPALDFRALPADAELETALPKDHPWLLKAEHGPWFILVKSYVRPSKGSDAEKRDPGMSARELAEGLADEIRDTFRVQAFLYEYISEDRKAEMRAIAAARQKARTDYLNQVRAIQQKSQLQGMEFLMPDNKLHIRRHDARDQIGVLVGGFQNEADAIKALAKLKTWPAPKNQMLMDGSAIVQKGADGKPQIVTTRLNPYATAFVVQNPSAARAVQPNATRPSIDPFIVTLNEGQPYSLLKATKGWTLAVKSFTAPVEIVSKDTDTSLMRRFGASKGADALAAGAEQAEAMAKAIRAMRGPSVNGQPGAPLNLEAFVLHTRNASLVTVGQFDGPDDPALQATRRLLLSIKPRVTEDATGLRPATNAPSLFDNCMPMPIPKADER